MLAYGSFAFFMRNCDSCYIYTMELLTTVDIPKSGFRLDYTSHLAFVGSCFADNISKRFAERKFRTLVNPFGTVYNPLSIAMQLKDFADGKNFDVCDVFQDMMDGTHWHCWEAHGSLSAPTREECVARLNSAAEQSRNFLREADAVFVTLGSAYVYFLKETGSVVSNCHRQNTGLFSRELVSVDCVYTAIKSIVESLSKMADPAGRGRPLHIVFTVSPLRHLGDGAHGNNLSKATLQLAVNQVVAEFASERSGDLSGEVSVEYFPSYEIVMDELRDYRFYDADMVHLSETAEEYIFERMAETYCNAMTCENMRKVEKFLKSARHRISDDSTPAAVEFAKKCLAQAAELELQIPGLDLGEERNRFQSLLSIKL